MKTKPLTAAQIDTLAQRLSKAPIAPSAKMAGDNLARRWRRGLATSVCRISGHGPTRPGLATFSYCEGGTTLKEGASPEEFADELREIDAWNRAHGDDPARFI